VKIKKLLVFLFLLAVAGPGAGELPEPALAAKDMLAKLQPDCQVFQGDNGYLYAKNELQHIAFGKIPAEAQAGGNPLHAILEYHRGLKKHGIELILLPVPPKLALQPCGGMMPGQAGIYLQSFYAELRKAGVQVLDLIALWQSNKNLQPFCRGDSHWSPEGMDIAAKQLAELINQRGQSGFTRESRSILVNGDLQALLKADAVAPESLTVQRVSPSVWSESSPVLLLGDSHLLFLSSGADMLAEDSGFGEQLAYWLQMPVERIAVKGSAANAVRINLFRKAAKNPAWLESKKIIVWCFSSREFTTNIGTWRDIPVSK
jgi:alginate O-acetyltransferase complex protein AlgJ